MGVTIRCSLFLWTATFSLPFSPNVVPAHVFQRRCLARFRSESLGGVSHSDGYSVVNRQNKKPIHRDIKNRREHGSHFKMMKLCIGSVNSETIYLLINHSASRFAFMSGAALVAATISSYFEVSFCIQLLFFCCIFYYILRNICLSMLLRKVLNISPKIGAYY